MASQNRYVFLDNMKAIAILMVIAIHSIAFSTDMSDELRAHILVIIVTIAVPVFFFVDGYLLAVSFSLRKKNSYWDSIKKSSYRLLLPWLIFSLGYFVLRYIFEYFNFLDERYILGRDIKYIILGLYGSVYAGQMYFLVSLFFIRLLSPLISFVFNRSSLVIAILLCAACIVLHSYFHDEIYKALYISDGQEPLMHAIWGVQYFIIGILAFRIVSIIDVKWLLLTCGCFIAASYFFNIYEVFQLAFLLSFFVFLKTFTFENKMVSYVGRNTMGIYLLHSPLILKATSICVAYFVSDPLVIFFLNLSITAVLTVCAVYFLELTGISPYLFGEKNKKHRNAVLV